jgi:hypothetical protein
MKRVWLVGVLLLVVVGISAAMVGDNGGKGSCELNSSKISVTGYAAITTEPDKAVVYLGVRTESANIGDALKENSLKMKAVIEALKEFGVPEECIKTQYFNIYPMQERFPLSYPPSPETKPSEMKTVYRVINSIAIEITDLDKVSKVIRVAVNAGANMVMGVHFMLSDEKMVEMREKAIKKAYNDASSKTKAIANCTGLKIVKVTEVKLGVYGDRAFLPVPIPTPVVAGVSPPIVGGVQVSASLNVVYECK